MRIGILGSTRGTHLHTLATSLPKDLGVVISNKADAGILSIAKMYQIPGIFLNAEGLTREGFDQKISEELLRFRIEFIVLIGFMRILSSRFVRDWPNKIINVHPSLLPAFSGKMDLSVHRAVLDAGVKQTGCTVHFVTEEVDAGPILLQKKCDVLPFDTPESLKARVQKLEAEALIEAISSQWNRSGHP